MEDSSFDYSSLFDGFDKSLYYEVYVTDSSNGRRIENYSCSTLDDAISCACSSLKNICNQGGVSFDKLESFHHDSVIGVSVPCNYGIVYDVEIRVCFK